MHGIDAGCNMLPCAVGVHGTDTDIMHSAVVISAPRPARNPRVINHTFGTLGKSGGRWRIGISGATWCDLLRWRRMTVPDRWVHPVRRTASVRWHNTALVLRWRAFQRIADHAKRDVQANRFTPNFTASTVIVLVELTGRRHPIHNHRLAGRNVVPRRKRIGPYFHLHPPRRPPTAYRLDDHRMSTRPITGLAYQEAGSRQTDAAKRRLNFYGAWLNCVVP